ncbi:MAG: NUDIX domain-containing protein [Anaerolineae bacterium]|nr:NUDIX domain-containing protein [Anaerolineae bacterium]
MGHADQGVEKSKHRYQVIPRTLCFITHGDEVLLLQGGPHKRLWAGRYNGVGGHIEAGEDVHTAALREIVEETGLAVHDLRLAGIVHADAGDPAVGILFFVFTARAASKEIGPSPDGALEWWPIDRLPASEMVEDLPVLLPRALGMGLADPPFFAAYRYDEQDRLIISFAEQT